MVYCGIIIFYNYKEWDYFVDDLMIYLYSFDVIGDDIFDVCDLLVFEGVDFDFYEDIIVVVIDSGELDIGD